MKAFRVQIKIIIFPVYWILQIVLSSKTRAYKKLVIIQTSSLSQKSKVLKRIITLDFLNVLNSFQIQIILLSLCGP